MDEPATNAILLGVQIRNMLPWVADLSEPCRCADKKKPGDDAGFGLMFCWGHYFLLESDEDFLRNLKSGRGEGGTSFEADWMRCFSSRSIA